MYVNAQRHMNNAGGPNVRLQDLQERKRMLMEIAGSLAADCFDTSLDVRRNNDGYKPGVCGGMRVTRSSKRFDCFNYHNRVRVGSDCRRVCPKGCISDTKCSNTLKIG